MQQIDITITTINEQGQPIRKNTVQSVSEGFLTHEEASGLLDSMNLPRTPLPPVGDVIRPEPPAGTKRK